MWVEEAKDMPWALALGVSPAVATQAGSRCPDWVDEYDLASALLDDAIDMVPCETNDLLVPADCEIVIEGVVSANEVESEGPFGEYPGYLPDHTMAAPRQTITAVTFRNDPILPISLPGVPTDNCHVSMGFFMSADIAVALRAAGLRVIDAMLTFESANHRLVVRVPNEWHNVTGWTVDEFMNKIGTAFWTQHAGGSCTKILVVGEVIDPADPNSVTWAFATRNHPIYGAYYFPELESKGTGLEAYHSVNDLLRGKGGLVIYNCLPLQERLGLPKKLVMSYERNYPQAIRDKVEANWARWGFSGVAAK